MDPIDSLAAGIKLVDEMLDEAALEPDPGRDDWSGMKTRLALVRERLDSEVLDGLDEAVAAAEEERVRGLIKGRVATLLSAMAAALHAGGDTAEAASLLGRARDLASGERREELEAAVAEPRAHNLLEHARWLLYHGKRDQADRVAKAALRATRAGPLVKGARAVLHAPRPIQSAPSLFRVNGCGTGLYGERDRNDEGWYVATYCICLIFIPVFPLAAYRVRHAGDNSYQFAAKERLGPIARAWQALVAGAIAVSLAVGGVHSYLDSPAHKARVAEEAAQAAETRGDRDGALTLYRDFLRDHGGHGNVGPAALSVVRLASAPVPDPCTRTSVEAVWRANAAFQEMPPAARAAAAKDMGERLVRWADQIGDRSPEDARAALTVLDMAVKAAEDGGSKEAVDARRGRLTKTLADAVAAERPLYALSLYVRPPVDPASIDAAAKIVEGLGKGPSLWIEAEPDVLAWADAAAKRAGLDEAARRAREQVRAAHEAQKVSAARIESSDEKHLADALKASPEDQELAVAVAQQRRRQGDLRGAVALLSALGPPGRLTAPAQQVLAACAAESGDLPRADAILSALVAERLPAFQEAQRTYLAAEEQSRTAIVNQAETGQYNHELEPKLKGVADADKQRVLHEWLNDKLEADPHLKALREAFVRHASLVPASLALGQVKLRRANEASGEERRALLAAAEQAFLSIQGVAEGNPTYHLGLGQVYHRLGRTEEGNKELKRLVDAGRPEITLAVVDVYRDLGLPVQAKQIAEQVYQTSTDEKVKHGAAVILAHLVNEVGFNEDEEETWLKRADQSTTGVQQLLLALSARRLARKGQLPEADKAYGKLVEGYERGAARDASQANNAAVSYAEWYQTNGDPAHLRAAARHLEAAHRLTPQNAMVAGNLASMLAHLGRVSALDRWIKTSKLPLGAGEASMVLGALAAGPLREDVLATLRKDNSFRRSLDVSAEEQALAPQKAGGYERVEGWLTLNEDEKGLAELDKRLAAMPPFDASAIAEERRVRRARTKADFDKALAEQGAARAETAAHRAEQTGHAPTIAVAWLLVGTHRASLANVDPTPEHLDGAVDAVRKAAQGWPEGGLEEFLPSTLTLVGVLRAGPESPAVARVLAADGRVFTTAMLLSRAVSGDGGADALAALRRRPEIQEATRLRKARPGRHPSSLDVMLARIAGDPEMETAASAVFSRKDTGAELSIDARLAPGQDVEAYALSFFQTAGKPAPAPHQTGPR